MTQRLLRGFFRCRFFSRKARCSCPCVCLCAHFCVCKAPSWLPAVLLVRKPSGMPAALLGRSQLRRGGRRCRSHGMPCSDAGRRHFRVNVSFCVSGFGAFFKHVGGTFNAHMKPRWFQSPGLIQKIHTNTMESVSLLRRMKFDTAEILARYSSQEPRWLVCHI